MNRLRGLVLLLAACSCAPAQRITVSGNNIQDSAGNKLASGTITFTPVNNAGRSISYRAAGGGPVLTLPVQANVVNGAFTISLPDTAVTIPAHVCFDVSVSDGYSDNLIGSGYTCVAPSSGADGATWCTTSSGATTCNLDNYTPNQPSLAVVQSGPPGPQGIAGVQGPPGSGNAAVGSTGAVQIALPNGNVGPSDATTLINARPVQDYRSITSLPLTRWHDALANASSQVVNLGLICDSYCVADAGNSTLPVPHNLHFVQRLRSYLQGAYGSNGTGVRPLIPGDDCSEVNLNWWNPSFNNQARPTCTAFAGPSGEGTGGGTIAVMGSGDYVYFQDYGNEGETWDTFHLYWAKNGSTGNAPSVSVGPTANFSSATTTTAGSGDTTKTLSNGAVVHRYDAPAIAAGANTAKITCTTGPCYVWAGQGTLGTTGVNVHNFGVGSADSGYFESTPDIQNAFFDLVPGGFQAVGFGHLQNEPGDGDTQANYAAHIANFVSHFSAYSDPPSLFAWSTIACGITGVDPFYAVLRSSVQTNGLAYIDIRSHQPTYNSSAPSDLCGDGHGAFTGHPSTKGNAAAFSLFLTGLLDTPTPVSRAVLGSCPSGQAVTGITSTGLTCGVVSGTVSCGGTPPSGALFNWAATDGSGTTLSESVSGNTATITGGTATWATPSGLTCPAPTYSGGAYAVAASGAASNFSRTSSFSISTWVNPSSLPSFSPVWGNYDGSNGYVLGLDNVGDLIMQLIASGGGSIAVQTSQKLSTATLYNVVVTYSGTGSASNMLVYINGSAVTTTATTNTLTGSAATTNPFRIGSFTGASTAFSGTQFGTIIYSRVLTPSEVSTIYSSGVR